MSLAWLDLHSLYGWFGIGLLSGVLSYFSCIKALSLAEKNGMLVQPGERQSHINATPTGGGLGLIFSLLVILAGLQMMLPLPVFWWQNMLPGILILAIIGWFDDKRPVSSLLRLLVQLAVSLWLLGYGGLQFSLAEIGMFASAIVAIIWLMNLYNFMDGSNGMAGFQGLFAGLVMAVLFQSNGQSSMALIALVVAAACAGFLPLNFPRARVFMGDVASVPLGFIFASLAVYGAQTGSLSLAISILIMSVFLVDSTMTLLARVLWGERWYTAHAKHVYQRLIAQGWSHRQVLVVYQTINIILVLPAIALAEIYPQYATITVGLTLLLLGASWQIVNWRLSVLATVQLK